MDASRSQAPGPNPVSLFVGNLPVVVLFAAGYFGGFAYLWGPMRPWKVILAVAVVLALCFALDRRGRKAKHRAAPRAGSRAAEAEAAWPWWRRVAAIFAGLAIAGIGVYQSLGIEVDISYYPLISGLCFIVSLGFGIPLALIALPRKRWRPGVRSGRAKRTRGATMSVSPPAGGGHSGVWGGFGSKPARKPWKPGS